VTHFIFHVLIIQNIKCCYHHSVLLSLFSSNYFVGLFGGRILKICAFLKCCFIIFIRWIKKVHLGRGSSGKRVGLMEFVKRQRQRTKARLAQINKPRKPFLGLRRGNPCLNPSLAKEKWNRGRRGRQPKYLGTCIERQLKSTATLPDGMWLGKRKGYLGPVA